MRGLSCLPLDIYKPRIRWLALGAKEGFVNAVDRLALCKVSLLIAFTALLADVAIDRVGQSFFVLATFANSHFYSFRRLDISTIPLPCTLCKSVSNLFFTISAVAGLCVKNFTSRTAWRVVITRITFPVWLSVIRVQVFIFYPHATAEDALSSGCISVGSHNVVVHYKISSNFFTSPDSTP